MSNWVNCPVCGEPDMLKEGAQVRCTNDNCGSNGGTNFKGVRPMTLFKSVKTASQNGDKVVPQRSPYAVLAAAQAELGETAEEVAIMMGDSYKVEGPDGAVGEALDTIISLLDLIHVINPDLDEEDLVRIAGPKLDKWISKMTENQHKFRKLT